MERKTLSATTIIGDDVRNVDGDDLGEVTDIMIDLETGRVAYAVLDTGGFLGLGGKLFAVPWSAMTVDTDEHEVVVDIDKSRLENAPGFDKDKWPDFSDRAWGKSVYDYYHQAPYWQ